MTATLEEIIAKLRGDAGHWLGDANARALLAPIFAKNDAWDEREPRLFEVERERDVCRALLTPVERRNAQLEEILRADPHSLQSTYGRIVSDRDDLARWKREQLAVTAWWATIDDLCRKHPDIRLGDHVSAFALRMIQQRDEMAAALREFKASLEQLPRHLAFGSEARAVIAVIIARCEQLAPTPLAPQPEPLAGLSP